MSIKKAAHKALLRSHSTYGEEVRLLKRIHTATGGIYRQGKRMYESPYIIKGCVSREPNEHMLGRTGEESERNAQITIPIAYMRELFGSSTALEKMITTGDLIVMDNRVWRITQASLTGRVGSDPLLMYIKLREKLGSKEKDYE